jgi:glutathione S-transferase
MMEEMKLYYLPHSPACRRVLAVAFHLQLPVELRELPYGDEGHPDARRARQLNPSGRVPVLEDGEYSLWESNAIMEYLCTRKIGQTLFPEDEKTRIDIARWQFWQTAHLSPPCETLQFENFRKKNAGRGPADTAEVQQALVLFRREATVLDHHLKSRRFLVGDQISLADFSVGSCLSNWKEAQIPLEEFRNLREWYGHLDTVEAWRKTAPKAR